MLFLRRGWIGFLVNVGSIRKVHFLNEWLKFFKSEEKDAFRRPAAKSDVLLALSFKELDLARQNAKPVSSPGPIIPRTGS